MVCLALDFMLTCLLHLSRELFYLDDLDAKTSYQDFVLSVNQASVKNSCLIEGCMQV